ncbi:MAG: Rab family GTPase [Promethearchaeota archaeon]
MKRLVKLSLGGDGGVGKTTFLHRYCNGVFLPDTKLTVGVNFFNKIFKFKNYEIEIVFWALGGQDQFRFLLPEYVKGSLGGLIFFSLRRMNSFINIKEWVKLMRDNQPGLPLILVGTKADLESTADKIDDGLIEDTRKKFGFIDYIRTSSKTGEGINLPIERLLKYLMENNMI